MALRDSQGFLVDDWEQPFIVSGEQSPDGPVIEIASPLTGGTRRADPRPLIDAWIEAGRPETFVVAGLNGAQVFTAE